MTPWDFFLGAGFVLLVTAAAIYLTEWLRSDAHKSKRTPHAAPSNNNDPNGPSADFSALIDAINYQGEATRTEEQSEDRGKIFRESIVIALLILNLYFLYRQVDEMIRVYGPIKIQAEAANVANRAWIKPLMPVLGWPVLGRPIDFQIPYENVGRSPALSMNWNVDTGYFDTPPDNNGSLIKVRENVTCDGTAPDINGEIEFPVTSQTGDAPFPHRYQHNSGATLHKVVADADMLLEHHRFYIQGCVTYSTTGVVGHTRFCFYFLPNQNRNWDVGGCPGNWAD